MSCMTQPAQAKAGIITDAMKHVAEVEMVSPETIRAAVAAGLASVLGVVYARDHVNGSASANGKH